VSYSNRTIILAAQV